MFGVGFLGLCPGAGIELWLPPVAAPQNPALLFSFARLAKFGPLLCAELLFAIPAVALAEVHKEPKASPLDDVAGFAAGLPSVAAVDSGVEELD